MPAYRLICGNATHGTFSAQPDWQLDLGGVVRPEVGLAANDPRLIGGFCRACMRLAPPPAPLPPQGHRRTIGTWARATIAANLSLAAGDLVLEGGALTQAQVLFDGFSLAFGVELSGVVPVGSTALTARIFQKNPGQAAIQLADLVLTANQDQALVKFTRGAQPYTELTKFGVRFLTGAGWTGTALAGRAVLIGEEI